MWENRTPEGDDGSDEEGEAEGGFAGQVELQGLNWLTDPLGPGAEVQIQLRHRAKACSARIKRAGSGGLVLTLAEPQFAVTPGQSGVLLQGDRVLGGGRISGSG